ncbi:MAG: carboxypeptidase regulatory-like domain-containing protein, partial [Myxococcota bacterium]
TVSGSVLDALTGDPVSGALLSIQSLGATAMSDRDGEFTFRLLPPGTHTVTVSAEGYGEQSMEVTVVDADVEGLEILLGRDGGSLSLSGTVTIVGLDLPVQGASVALTGGETGPRETTTDARGSYTLLGLSPGAYDVAITAGGYSPHLEALDLELPTELDVALERLPDRGFSLSGTVQLEGMPGGDREGTTVSLAHSEDPGSIIEEVSTSAGGDFLFEDLAPAAYRLEASREGFVPAGLTVIVAADTVQHFILYPSEEEAEGGLMGCESGGGGLPWPLVVLLPLAFFCLPTLVGRPKTSPGQAI